MGPASESIFAFDTPFGTMAIAWECSNQAIRLRRVYLPGEIDLAAQQKSGALPAEPAMAELVEALHRYLDGGQSDFTRQLFDLDAAGFAGRALLACRQIPRGRVSTYGALAARLAAPRAARAVGTAMAHNPFPLIIPCHRIVRANGDPGCFGGGRAMKRVLLAMEGVRFDKRGKVLATCLW